MQAASSLGGLLGTSSGPQAPGVVSGNEGLNNLLGQGQALENQGSENSLNQYGLGNVTADQAMQGQYGLTPEGQQGFNNALATGATTGSKYATDQVQGNSLLSGGLNSEQGQLQAGQGLQSSQTDILNGLQNQGYNLTQGDNTLYGQESGQIANQFGQQANQTANSLASRGLSNSGAAGAAFSGIAGNQNQMLANAQQQISQQRFQNTMSQIGQQQQFIGQLNAQNNQAAGQYANTGANDINQQYGRQLQGANYATGSQAQAAGLQNTANSNQNTAGLAASTFNAQNSPYNLGDFAGAGIGQSVQDGAPGFLGSLPGTIGGLFAGGGADAATAGAAGGALGAGAGSGGVGAATMVAGLL